MVAVLFSLIRFLLSSAFKGNHELALENLALR